MYRILLFAAGILLYFHSYGLKPAKRYEAIPDTLKLPFEKTTITTSDNVKLKSWTFLPEKQADNNITLVLAYADAGNMSWWLTQATVLSQVGFTVVMFDYRGFGESDAFTIDPKMLYYNEFSTDLAAVIQYAKKKYPKHKTGVWAFSMGTIIATLAAKTTQPDFMIGDGFVTNPEIIKTFYAKKK
jgi:alpha-beta hydrolase superfamily lysophospholipase